MTESWVMQGRRIEPVEFLQLRQLVARHPEWSRDRLSRERCVLWNWRSPNRHRLAPPPARPATGSALACDPDSRSFGQLGSADDHRGGLVPVALHWPPRRRLAPVWLLAQAGTAVISSIIVSCRRRGINPQACLTDVLRNLPGLNITQIDQWRPEHGQPQCAPVA